MLLFALFFFFKQKTAYEMRIGDWSSDVCSSDLLVEKIKEAFFSFDFTGTALGEEFKGVSKFIPISYKKDWAVIREIQKANRSEEHTSELQSLMRISYAVFCLKKTKNNKINTP